MNAATMRGQRGNGNHDPPIKVDYLEAGSSGPVVMLVHSSVSGARQWRRLMRDLKDQFRVRAVNLFGYGKTTAWPAETIQSLDDQARLVEAALPANADEVYLVGHSFGGSVAMKAAARLEGRVARLVLLETNPFYLLAQSGRVDAFAEAMELRNYIKKFGALGEWATAAEKFADYWGGTGTWREMSLDRRAAFSEGLKPNFFEWDAVMNETTPVEQWATLLPGATLLVCDPRTVLPIREITAVLRRSCPGWAYKEVPGAGHMAPLTRPDLINPLVASFLGAAENNEGIELAAPNSRLRQSPLNACNVRETVCESAMSSTIRNAKSGSIQDTAAERWSRLYVDVRASYGRAAIQAALLLNGAASVALLAFLGNLAVAQQTNVLAGNFVTFKEAFVCFGIGVMLAASSSVVAFLIQNVAIAHPKDAEGRTGRRLRSVGIGMVVASLSIFAVGITVAANALGNLVGSLEVTSQ